MSYTRVERGELYRREVVRQVFIFMLKIHYLIDGWTGSKRVSLGLNISVLESG